MWRITWSSACVALTCHVKDAIAGSDMGQEGVPQALAGMGTLHQACNVHHIKECWNFAANQEDKTKRDFKNEVIWESRQLIQGCFFQICLFQELMFIL